MSQKATSKAAPQDPLDVVPWAAQLLIRAQSERRFGEVTFHFEDGRIRMATETATFMPPAPGRSIKETGG